MSRWVASHRSQCSAFGRGRRFRSSFSVTVAGHGRRLLDRNQPLDRNRLRLSRPVAGGPRGCGPVARIRKHNGAQAEQIEEAASSAAANLFEGNRREGRDRRQFFLIAAGSADETRGHLLTAEAWGWVQRADVEQALEHADHLLAILWKLTH